MMQLPSLNFRLLDLVAAPVFDRDISMLPSLYESCSKHFCIDNQALPGDCVPNAWTFLILLLSLYETAPSSSRTLSLLPLCRSVYRPIFRIFNPLHTPHLTLVLIGRRNCNTVTRFQTRKLLCPNRAKENNLVPLPHSLQSPTSRFFPRSSRSWRPCGPSRSDPFRRNLKPLSANCCLRCWSGPLFP